MICRRNFGGAETCSTSESFTVSTIEEVMYDTTEVTLVRRIAPKSPDGEL
jgi:hypothetical protein